MSAKAQRDTEQALAVVATWAERVGGITLRFAMRSDGVVFSWEGGKWATSVHEPDKPVPGCATDVGLTFSFANSAKWSVLTGVEVLQTIPLAQSRPEGE